MISDQKSVARIKNYFLSSREFRKNILTLSEENASLNEVNACKYLTFLDFTDLLVLRDFGFHIFLFSFVGFDVYQMYPNTKHIDKFKPHISLGQELGLNGLACQVYQNNFDPKSICSWDVFIREIKSKDLLHKNCCVHIFDKRLNVEECAICCRWYSFLCGLEGEFIISKSRDFLIPKNNISMQVMNLLGLDQKAKNDGTF